MRIRQMERKDAAKAAAIEEEIFSMPWSKQAFLEALDLESTLFLAAEEEGELAGYIGLYLAADEGEITNVAVRERYRRRRIAESLIEHAMCTAAERGAAKVFLEVRPSNTGAIALYEKTGFIHCGTRRGFYEKPREDAYVMMRPDISTILTGP